MSAPGTVRPALAGLVVALLAGCATVPRKDLSKFIAAQPRSILVVPVVNSSMDVTAADYFLSTVPVPLAERGYYVFPVNVVKRLLEDDGLSDPSLVHAAPVDRLGNLFGADAVLYITIQRWEAKWVLVSTQVLVEFEYALRDVKTGTVIWQDREQLVYASDSGGGGLLGAIVSAAITKASPNYLPLAQRANAQALAYPGPGLPAGPYLPEHGRDYLPPPPGVNEGPRAQVR